LLSSFLTLVSPFLMLVFMWNFHTYFPTLLLTPHTPDINNEVIRLPHNHVDSLRMMLMLNLNTCNTYCLVPSTCWIQTIFQYFSNYSLLAAHVSSNTRFKYVVQSSPIRGDFKKIKIRHSGCPIFSCNGEIYCIFIELR